jgi:hypothetical protein
MACWGNTVAWAQHSDPKTAMMMAITMFLSSNFNHELGAFHNAMTWLGRMPRNIEYTPAVARYSKLSLKTVVHRAKVGTRHLKYKASSTNSVSFFEMKLKEYPDDRAAAQA